MPKIKSSLFSPDGKLISASSNNNAPAAKTTGKKSVDAELAALRSGGVKKSVFSEDGKLLETPREVKPQSMSEKLGKLIERRVKALTLEKKNTTDELKAENLETQIWFLNDQKGSVSQMTPQEQGQLYEMILADSGEESKKETVPTPEKKAAPEEKAAEPKKEAAASEPKKPPVPVTPISEPKVEKSPEKKSAAVVPAPVTPPEPKKEKAAPKPVTPSPEPVKLAEKKEVAKPAVPEPEKEKLAPVSPKRVVPVPAQVQATSTPEPKKEEPASASVVEKKEAASEPKKVIPTPVEPVHTQTAPTPAPLTSSKSSMKDPYLASPNKQVSMHKDMPEPRSSLLIMRSSSFSNLDDLDLLLTGGEIAPQEEELLAWSTTKPHHLSDWKIIVENEQEGTMTTYHVHKLVLSTGPTKSEHFERRFMAATGNNVTDVLLSKSAAYAMPQLLDFMYSREDTLELNSQNAIGLRHLGKLYGIRKLVVLVTKFLSQDLKAPKSLHFLNAAAEFQDITVMTRAAQVCAGSILTVDRDGLTDLDPPLFTMVVTCDTVGCKSEGLSRIVGEFCRKNEDVMNHDLLQAITSSKNMHDVDCSEAVYLLHLSEKHEKKDAKSNLESRCILSGSVAWSGTLVGQLKAPPGKTGPYDELSAELKVKLLEDSLLKAEEGKKVFEVQKSEIMEGVNKRIKRVLAEKEVELETFGKEVQAAQAVAARYGKELANFKRLPTDYKATKPIAYNPDGTKKEKERPDAMPANANPADEIGCVVRVGSNLWPMYYYRK